MSTVVSKILNFIFEKLLNAPLIAIFGIAVGFRVLAFWLMGDRLFPDSVVYVQSGIDLFVKGQITSDYYMPLYPIITYLMGGRTGGIYFDIIASALLVPLAFRLSLSLFGNRSTAILVGWAVAIYPYFIFYASTLLTETIFLTLLVASYYLFYTHRAMGGSFVWVLNLLIKPVGELFLAPLLILFGIIQGWSVAKYSKVFVSTLLFYLILMVPWWAHNFKKYDQFVRLTLADGVVLYSGNNPMNKSGGGIMNADGTGDVNLKLFDHIEDPVARNHAMKRAAFEYIKEDFGRFTKMAFIKFERFWRLWPYANQFDGLHYILISLFSYGILLLLSIWRLIEATKKEWRILSPILFFAVYLTLVHMVTIGSIRYRLPLEIFVIILGVDQIRRVFQTKLKMKLLNERSV